MKRSSVLLALGLLVCTTGALADSGDRGDRIENRLDRRGDVVDNRLDRSARRAARNGHDVAAERLDARGDRVNGRLDRRGNRIDRRLDRR
jgi:hypothetical protein